jgi:hypothetical protein
MVMLGKRTLAALVVFCVKAMPVAAQDYCESLRNQLAQLPTQSGEEQYIALLNQLNRDRADYNRVFAQARELNCFALFQRFASPQCPVVRRALSDLQSDIASLERATRLANPTDVARANLIGALQQRDCPVSSTYRTLCVRPSDGYFYPLAYAAMPDVFAQHELVCQAQCDGAMLFVHRNPGEDIEDAVDLQGQRYVDLPNAFVFRERFDPDSACRPSPGLAAWLQNELAANTVEPSPAPPSLPAIVLVPLPKPRPEPSEDPETILNRVGGHALIGGQIAAAERWNGLVNGEGVRLIGPAFYYAQ